MGPVRIEVHDKMREGVCVPDTVPFGERFHPDFTPELTPAQVPAAGIFGGRRCCTGLMTAERCSISLNYCIDRLVLCGMLTS
jgi:hypothetical protein